MGVRGGDGADGGGGWDRRTACASTRATCPTVAAAVVAAA